MNLRVVCAAVIVAISVIWSHFAWAADKSASELLPTSVAGYLEITKPADVVETALQHPLAKLVAENPDYQKALESPEYEKYLAVIKAVEDKLGMQLRPALKTLAAEGIYIGGDLATQGVVVLVRSSDPKLTEKARDVLVDLARADAEEKGQADPITLDDHRGIKLYQNKEVRLASHDRWLIIASKPLLIRAVLNNLLDDDAPSLSGETQFQTAYKQRPARAAAWGYADLRLIRTTGILTNALSKKSDNPGIELLAGGIVGALPAAPYVTLSLMFDKQHAGLTVSLPADVPAVAKQREFFFGSDGHGQSPPLLAPQQALFALSTYRDFFSMWRHAPDLFNEEVNAKFAEAETGLSTLFSGRNFRDDILGNLEPGIQLVAARQTFKEGEITPAMKLPAGALVVKLKNPKETAQIFKITFQSAIGFLNVVGGMNGLDPLDVNSEKQGDMLVVAAEYLPPKDDAVRKAAPPHFNATPTAVFVGNRFILSSTKSLALELAGLIRKEESADKELNTAIATDLQVLRDVLTDNQEPLIANNMLEKGHDRVAAEKEITALLAALGTIKDTSLQLHAGEKQLSLSWDINFK